MAKPAGATQEKRRRERNRKEIKEEKSRERALKKEGQSTTRAEMIANGEDPDLAGIVAGPQEPTEDLN